MYFAVINERGGEGKGGGGMGELRKCLQFISVIFAVFVFVFDRGRAW